MTDSGNIHLYATIDGQERRRVFAKKGAQYEAVHGVLKKPLSKDEQEDSGKIFQEKSLNTINERAQYLF